MVQSLYSVYDSKASYFLTPWPSRSDGVARRGLFENLQAVAIIHLAVVFVPRNGFGSDEVVLQHHRERVENQFLLFGSDGTHRNSPFLVRIGLFRCRELTVASLSVGLPGFLEIIEIVGSSANLRPGIGPSRCMCRRIACLRDLPAALGLADLRVTLRYVF